jgi:5-methylcytosine-specific restriction endonuclease McrA
LLDSTAQKDPGVGGNLPGAWTILCGRTDVAERTCGWCGVSIADMRSNAKYCSVQHKKNAGSQRHRERNPTYYRDLNRQPARAAYLAAWREANVERIRAYAREQQVRYRAEHPTAAAEWWKANPTKHRLYQAERRFRQATSGPGVSERDWLRLVRRYDGRCAYCNVQCDPHMDHVIPLKLGGRHSIGNILPACQSCNSSKGARLLYRWRVSVLLTAYAKELADGRSPQ